MSQTIPSRRKDAGFSNNRSSIRLFKNQAVKTIASSSHNLGHPIIRLIVDLNAAFLRYDSRRGQPTASMCSLSGLQRGSAYRLLASGVHVQDPFLEGGLNLTAWGCVGVRI